MIIGKRDKETVGFIQRRYFEAGILIIELKNDLEKIANYLKSIEDFDTTGDPVYLLWYDIGKCYGFLDGDKDSQ